MTHNTREVEEGVDAVFQAVMSDLKKKYRVSDTLSDVLSDSLSKHLTEAITTLYQEVDHQLQKARHDWLREEIVKLEGMKIGNTSHTLHCIKGRAENHNHCVMNPSEKDKAHDKALQTIIDRYHSELDQDNSNNT